VVGYTFIALCGDARACRPGDGECLAPAKRRIRSTERISYRVFAGHFFGDERCSPTTQAESAAPALGEPGGKGDRRGPLRPRPHLDEGATGSWWGHAGGWPGQTPTRLPTTAPGSPSQALLTNRRADSNAAAARAPQAESAMIRDLAGARRAAATEHGEDSRPHRFPGRFVLMKPLHFFFFRCLRLACWAAGSTGHAGETDPTKKTPCRWRWSDATR